MLLGMFNFQLFSYFLFFCLFKLVSCDNEICKYEEIPYPGVNYLSRGDPSHNTSYSAAIITYWDESNGGFTYCNGFLLNFSFVITTASCLMHTKCARDKHTKQFKCVNAHASDYQAIMGTTYVISNEKSYIRDGKTIHINPNFTKSKNYSYDIGMLELATPFPDVKNYIMGNGIHAPMSQHYYNFLIKNSKEKLAIMFYGTSTCSSFFSPDVKRNKYMFISNPERKYSRLQEILVDNNIDEEECKRLFETYKNLGMELCPYNVFCIKTLYPVPNCADLSGASFAYIKHTAIIGMMISRPKCNMSQHFFILRLTAFTEFLFGRERTVDASMDYFEDTWC